MNNRKMMYSFEGDFRRRPQQNLAGASAHGDRLALIERAHQERQRREEFRKRTNSALTIQSFYRSYVLRQYAKNEQRTIFDECTKLNQNLTPDLLSKQIGRLIFFYDKKYDYNRLVAISQFLIKFYDICYPEAIRCKSHAWRLNKFLILCLKEIMNTEGQAQALPIRVLEVFTEFKVSEWTTEESNLYASLILQLVKNGYFTNMRKLLEARTPPLLERSPNPPNATASAIFNLIIRPIEAVKYTNQLHIIDTVMRTLCEEILSNEFSEPVSCFLLPALSSKSAYEKTFPYVQLISYLSREQNLRTTSWMLYSFLLLEPEHFSLNNSESMISNYLDILSRLSINLSWKCCSNDESNDDDDDMDENIDNSDEQKISSQESDILNQCRILINDDIRVKKLLEYIDHTDDQNVIQYICRLCHYLLISDDSSVHKYKLLYTLAFRAKFLRAVWNICASMTTKNSWSGNKSTLLLILSRGFAMTAEDTDLIVPPLTVFCELFSILISTLHDGEFSSAESIPFTLPELIPVIGILKDVCLGLVELAFPDSRPSIPQDYQLAVRTKEVIQGQKTENWIHLFKVSVQLLRQLHMRDLRMGFCPSSLWIASDGRITVLGERPSDVQLKRARRGYRPFRRLRTVTRDQIDIGPPASVKEVRFLTALRELPFAIPFATRVRVLQGLLNAERALQHGDAQEFLRGPAISIKLRRSHLYEDAFDKLSLENEPNLRLKMRVQLVNAAGLEEAGVDGGGMFREVLSELIHTAFDPNRGFFILAQDRSLYPNPGVSLIVEDFTKHYYFIGRLLGKALFENLLVDLPLAEFFLCKLVGPSIIDAHHLASLDPILHRSLISLKNYTGDVNDLGLDFTVVTNDLGETKTEELKAGGSNITVNTTNRIEYIHLMADYKLNRQIRAQFTAFRQGLDNVLPVEWLHMFNFKELQVLISGSEVPVDIDDLKRNTSYTGGYNESHPTIQMFWRVIKKFNDAQKKLLLKFVTSCSRPPLLGFKDLEPPFCIQLVGSADRLPTASTCINLLKLPEFSEESVLHDRLLYAIQSGSGFELS